MNKTISLLMLGFISVTLVMAGVLSAITITPITHSQQQLAFASTEEEPEEPEEEEPDTSQDESPQPDPEDDQPSGSSGDDNPTGDPVSDPTTEPAAEDPASTAIEQADPNVSLANESVDCPDGTKAATTEECPKTVDPNTALIAPPLVDQGCTGGTGPGSGLPCVPCTIGINCKPGGGSTGPTVPIPPTTGPIMNQEGINNNPMADKVVEHLSTGQMSFNKESILPKFSEDTQIQLQTTDDPVEGATLALRDLEKQGTLPVGLTNAIQAVERRDPNSATQLCTLISTDPTCGAGSGGTALPDVGGGTPQNEYFWGHIIKAGVVWTAKKIYEMATYEAGEDIVCEVPVGVEGTPGDEGGLVTCDVPNPGGGGVDK